MVYQQRARGFSLLELMIAVAIIGVLLRIAIPSYKNYVVRTNRTEATQFLIDLANRQQQYLMDARKYASTLAELNVTAPTRFSEFYVSTDASIFTTSPCSVNNSATPPTFTLCAVPKSGTQQASDGTLTIDSTGARSPVDKWK